MKLLHHTLMVSFAAFAVISLSACSDMKLVNMAAVEPEEDPRENIHLTGMKAEITSGSLVQHHIESSTATLVLGVEKRRLNVGDLMVTSYNDKGKMQGITEAGAGVVYLAADPILKRARSDMDFSGGVEYRVPQADDPTTNAVTMKTQELRWDGAAGLFRSPSYYEMIMQTPNKMTFMSVGDGFTATKDLQMWNVKHGGIGTLTDADMRVVNARKGEETLRLLERLDAAGNQPNESAATVSPAEGDHATSMPPAAAQVQPEQPGTVIDSKSGRKKAVIPLMKPPSSTADRNSPSASDSD